MYVNKHWHNPKRHAEPLLIMSFLIFVPNLAFIIWNVISHSVTFLKNRGACNMNNNRNNNDNTCE